MRHAAVAAAPHRLPRTGVLSSPLRGTRRRCPHRRETPLPVSAPARALGALGRRQGKGPGEALCEASRPLPRELKGGPLRPFGVLGRHRHEADRKFGRNAVGQRRGGEPWGPCEDNGIGPARAHLQDDPRTPEHGSAQEGRDSPGDRGGALQGASPPGSVGDPKCPHTPDGDVAGIRERRPRERPYDEDGDAPRTEEDARQRASSPSSYATTGADVPCGALVPRREGESAWKIPDASMEVLEGASGTAFPRAL